jgi:Ser/Thr protein kinase RdoA (MazF antagonist)
LAMKPYDQLTPRGRHTRLRRLALKALAHYPLQAVQVKFLSDESNVVFRVVSAQGVKLALRICSERETTLADNRAEVFLLNSLVPGADLHFAAPLARRDGEHITFVFQPGIAHEQRCMLFPWVSGRLLETCVTPARYTKLGRAMAEMHNQSQKLILPPQFSPRRWDKAFYYPDEPVVIHDRRYSHLFPSRFTALIDEVERRADHLLARMFSGAAPPMLIHGDLNPGNVFVQDDELHLIDFGDVMLGYPVQDAAVTLYYERNHPDYPQLVQAFQAGYASLRPYPAESSYVIQTLMANRKLMFVNYVARLWDEPQEFIQRAQAFFENYLAEFPQEETGEERTERRK